MLLRGVLYQMTTGHDFAETPNLFANIQALETGINRLSDRVSRATALSSRQARMQSRGI